MIGDLLNLLFEKMGWKKLNFLYPIMEIASCSMASDNEYNFNYNQRVCQTEYSEEAIKRLREKWTEMKHMSY